MMWKMKRKNFKSRQEIWSNGLKDGSLCLSYSFSLFLNYVCIEREQKWKKKREEDERQVWVTMIMMVMMVLMRETKGRKNLDDDAKNRDTRRDEPNLVFFFLWQVNEEKRSERDDERMGWQKDCWFQDEKEEHLLLPFIIFKFPLFLDVLKFSSSLHCLKRKRMKGEEWVVDVKIDRKDVCLASSLSRCKSSCLLDDLNLSFIEPTQVSLFHCV